MCNFNFGARFRTDFIHIYTIYRTNVLSHPLYATSLSNRICPLPLQCRPSPSPGLQAADPKKEEIGREAPLLMESNEMVTWEYLNKKREAVTRPPSFWYLSSYPIIDNVFTLEILGHRPDYWSSGYFTTSIYPTLTFSLTISPLYTSLTGWCSLFIVTVARWFFVSYGRSAKPSNLSWEGESLPRAEWTWSYWVGKNVWLGRSIW